MDTVEVNPETGGQAGSQAGEQAGEQTDKQGGPESTCYAIIVKGHLDGRWARQLGGLALTHLPGEQTLLAGSLPDQPALHGVLARIRDLGLTLVSLARCEDEPRTP